MAIETATNSGVIKQVETFAAGDYPGDRPGEIWSYTPEDVRTIARNFAALSEGENPEHAVPVVLTHDGVDAHGWVQAVKVKGDLLITDWRDVSDELRGRVRSKRLPKVSAEIQNDFTDRNGKVYPGPYLYRVAVIGADPPRVKGLKDIPATFADKPRRRITRVFRFADQQFCGGPGSGKPGPCPEGGGDKPKAPKAAKTPKTPAPKIGKEPPPKLDEPHADAIASALPFAFDDQGLAMAGKVHDVIQKETGKDLSPQQFRGLMNHLVETGAVSGKVINEQREIPAGEHALAFGSPHADNPGKGSWDMVYLKDPAKAAEEIRKLGRGGTFADPLEPIMDIAAALAFLGTKGIDVTPYSDQSPPECQQLAIAVATAWQQADMDAAATTDTTDTAALSDTLNGPGPKKVTVTQQYADARRQLNQEAAAALKTIKDAAAAEAKARQQRETEERVKAVRLFCDNAKESGQMSGAECDESHPDSRLNQLVALARLPQQTTTQKFADGKQAERTPLEQAMGEISLRPARKFSEKVAVGGGKEDFFSKLRESVRAEKAPAEKKGKTIHERLNLLPGRQAR